MKAVIFLIVVLLFAYILISEQKRSDKDDEQREDAPTDLPYRSKHILNSSEYSFYRTLKPFMDSRLYLICPKVGLKDLFEVLPGTKNHMKHWGKISQMHVDFLICDQRLRPLFAIELDDKNHRASSARQKDILKDALFAKADLPLYRVPEQSGYSAEDIVSYIPLYDFHQGQRDMR